MDSVNPSRNPTHPRVTTFSLCPKSGSDRGHASTTTACRKSPCSRACPRKKQICLMRQRRLPYIKPRSKLFASPRATRCAPSRKLAHFRTRF